MSGKTKTHERIIDAAEETPRDVALMHASLVLLLWALLAGVVVGAGCLATLKAVDLLQEVVWEGVAEALPPASGRSGTGASLHPGWRPRGRCHQPRGLLA